MSIDYDVVRGPSSVRSGMLMDWTQTGSAATPRQNRRLAKTHAARTELGNEVDDLTINMALLTSSAACAFARATKQALRPQLGSFTNKGADYRCGSDVSIVSFSETDENSDDNGQCRGWGK
jgi:hypothetical protein